MLLLGAHTSIAGGVYRALKEGEAIGASTVQIFTANQRRWYSPPLSKEAIALWHAHLKSTGLQKIMSHASYLMNLASPDLELRRKSQQALREEIGRCQQLGISFLNFHPGASVQSSREIGLDSIVAELQQIRDLLHDDSLFLLLEATAGQGSCLGSTFEELAYLVNALKGELPIGVCIDTCHVFAAGYDLRTKESLDTLLREFDRVVGLKYLKALHLNDSLAPFNSHRDRHAPIGQGQIGLEAFREIMRDPRLRDLPKYLETPGGPPVWKEEIALLKQFAAS